MPHIALLGDSVFDNSKYVDPGPDVVTQLQELLPEGWNASLRAVDGAVTEDVRRQLATLPPGVTHLVLSVGGNDLLVAAGDLLQAPVTVSSQAFLLLARAADVFESMYRATVEACLGTGLPLTACTVYNGNFADQEFQTAARVVVTTFNDRILRLCSEKGVSAIDLRVLCTEASDYANPIEPSTAGGAKISRAIWQAISSR